MLIMKILTAVTLLGIFSCGIGAETQETRDGWRNIARAPPNQEIELHIALTPSTPWSEIEQIALDIASPSHPNFRRHLSHHELTALTAPTVVISKSVLSWLQQYNVSGRIRGGMVEAPTTVGTAEKFLNAEYFQYEKNGDTVIRTPEYHIPAPYDSYINFVAPTTQFPFQSASTGPSAQELAQSSAANAPLPHNTVHKRASCGSGERASPECVKQVYNITYTPQPNRTTFAVYGTEAAVYNALDLNTYLGQYNAPAASAGATYQVVGSGDPAEVAGGFEAGFETALDTQTLLGIAWPARGILYNNGGVFGPNATFGRTYDRFVSFLQELLTNQTVPSVVSFSESTPEDRMDAAYARQLCNMMAMVGARGVTLVFSSGNNGANGDQPGGRHDTIFEPKFPASCPFVTAVGGTTDLANEVAATRSTMNGGGLGYWASGGGFSNLFARPSYQTTVVSGYISQNVPSTYSTESGYNASGRGYPDVSAFSTNVPATYNGLTIGIGGTSAAAPIWAAVITILNDYQASRSQPPLGFINPWLYSLRSGVIKDITGGGNNAGDCVSSQGCTLPRTLGYNTTTGWDAVTGLGSPNVGLLIQALQTNPSNSTSSNGTTSSTSPSGTTTTRPSTATTSSSVASSNVNLLDLGFTIYLIWGILIMFSLCSL